MAVESPANTTEAPPIASAPAPYVVGFKRICRKTSSSVIAAALPKKKQAELGL